MILLCLFCSYISLPWMCGVVIVVFHRERCFCHPVCIVLCMGVERVALTDGQDGTDNDDKERNSRNHKKKQQRLLKQPQCCLLLAIVYIIMIQGRKYMLSLTQWLNQDSTQYVQNSLYWHYRCYVLCLPINIMTHYPH